MIPIDSYETAKFRMEDLLRACTPLDASLPIPHREGVAVPCDHPRLFGRGTNALIFSIDDVCEDYTRPETQLFLAGKVSGYAKKTEAFPEIPEGHYLLVGTRSGLSGIYIIHSTLETTLAALRDAGLEQKGITIPRIVEYDSEIHGKHMYITIMPDLREGGKYTVSDADGFMFHALTNGKELSRNFEEISQQLYLFVVSSQYKLHCAAHGFEDNPLEAIRHLFFVRYDASHEGQLIVGDVNHLGIAPARETS